MADSMQFYPTPAALARHVWSKVKREHIDRVLEPSAGEGDLILGGGRFGDRFMHKRRPFKVDAIEIDITKHDILRSKGIEVVGHDFMAFESGELYDLIVMNPPFASGVDHLLHAFDIAFDAEIVCILNAESVRNPFSKERRRLVDLIQKHGSCEFAELAFTTDETRRKTDVEIAIVRLEKKADAGSIIDLDRFTRDDPDSLADGYRQQQDLILPANWIQNQVRAFEAAVKAHREAAFATARASYYEASLGQTMAVSLGEKEGDDVRFKAAPNFVKRHLEEAVSRLKDRAWASILNSVDVTEKLSASAQQRLRSEFSKITKLEFTVQNVYGFLGGLIESQGDVQMQMIEDLFDEFTRYVSDNTVFYRGWKSNDRHRTAGWRLKTTRIILPRFNSTYGGQLGHGDRVRLADIDKVFAILAGKATPEFGLVRAVDERISDLRSGERVQTDWFDLRWYPGVGTIHLFPRSKDLIDRLNRIVGQRRAWIPQEGQAASPGFWKQYEEAERLDKALRAAVPKRMANYWGSPLESLVRGRDEDRAAAEAAVDAAAERIQAERGIFVDRLLESDGTVPLLAA